jgi:hypothetical protein
VELATKGGVRTTDGDGRQFFLREEAVEGGDQ